MIIADKEERAAAETCAQKPDEPHGGLARLVPGTTDNILE